MKIEVNVDKKGFLIVLGVVLILGFGIMGVIAYGTSDPQNFGHSAGEIELPVPVLLNDPIVVYTACSGASTTCESQSSSGSCDGVINGCVASGLTSGTIVAGSLGIPSNAKEILLYGSIDNTEGGERYIFYKHSSQSIWKRLVSNPGHGAYPNTNIVWIPLDSTGKLDWRISGSSGPQESQIEVHGYRVYNS